MQPKAHLHTPAPLAGVTQLVMLLAVSQRRREFVTERGYLLCRSYMLDCLLPRLQGDDKLGSIDLCLTTVRTTITGFVVLDQRKAA